MIIMDLWNQRDLVPPVLFTFQCKTKHCKDEIRALYSTIQNASDYFTNQQGFEKAAAYVSRFTVNWSNRFYNMHGFRLFKRINQALLRVRSVDIGRILLNLLSLLPEGTFLTKTIDLPTLANLDYLMIRLQGLSKLFCHIVAITREAARYYIRFISTGYFFNLNSIFICLLAEVWYKSRDICTKVVHYYEELYPLRNILQNNGKPWPTSGDCDLPKSLSKWLGDDWVKLIDIDVDSGEGILNIGTDSSLFLFLTGDDEDLASGKKIDAAIEKKIATGGVESSKPKELLVQRIKADEGEVVRRDSKPKATKTDLKVVDNVKSKFDVKKFLDDEKRKRQTDINQAVTGKVKDQVFNVFAKNMLRELNQLPTKELVQMFKEELSKIIRDKTQARKTTNK
ncbi:uncharacterized protein LOC129759418 [Uranotaenia lowii]|uniref:uncharacterized protein LOC129759418 n=1 Tax=Uranotaenia lowii TaxID=190385 RepID=UPI0024793632|nr:uncharacterized protein LOC129759418 [Uranotaenia lowii]